MTSIGDWLETARRQLGDAGIATAQLDSELLLAHALQTTRVWLKARPEQKLTSQQIQSVKPLLRRRCAREPLAYITGSKEFYGRDFAVTQDVLVPRPESETLVGLALDCGLPEDAAILDVGTGSGCLGITLALELRSSRITLLDVSPAALSIARSNAERLGATVSLLEADVLALDRTLDIPCAPFDLIVANLPYVDTSWERSPETKHEPSLALFSDAGGLWHYINFMAAALHFLKPHGRLVVEADPRQQDELSRFAHKLGYELAVRDGFALLYVREKKLRELPEASGTIKLFPR